MKTIQKSDKLINVCYDIRGPVLEEAMRLEEEGNRIIKLNVGNPAPFGFDAPDEIIQDVIRNLPAAQGYSESKGIFSARKAIMQDCQLRGIQHVEIDDILLGNGVSELIVMATQALLNNGDEVLIPAPDYPLWTAAVNLSGGKPVHYICDEESDWNPDIDDIRSKITPKTRAIVIINPNNPTGAVYDKAILQQLADLAQEHQLVVFADEIYDRILYEDAIHHPMATMIQDTLCVTFSGLSKSYRLAGFRSGWAFFTGRKQDCRSYIEGFNMLSSMRLCSNVPAQYAIQTALGGYQSINDLVLPKGRLYEQLEAGYDALTSIPGISCVKPKGSIYLFPKLDPKRYPVLHDEKIVLDFLKQEKILLVQGSAFNITDQQHLRVVFLPRVDDLVDAIDRFGDFIQKYKF
ncbi:Glutamate-pyruvate aminotransferase AlaA [BD1-7 clade bacterium]|uniref:alanine transaminase n=1 Tax=BD1-7 clade bacterium TaxID=2029982 RepID=A0A5S9Q306_9GAMM|nr:Glutamate-pyruvate aminotransferase AlaA [BD1-7 clade bacterium]CAA0111970.1 Glutamate-pyruvate aminotransferase AlaA [BD1-7 clade bacterium]